VQALLEAIEATEHHLRGLGFDPARLIGASGFEKIAVIKDGVEAVYTTDDSKRRFEILARQVFMRFRALVTEPTAYRYAERHDNIEAIYKKLTERRDTADVTELLKELHRIVNEAISTQAAGEDQAGGVTFDLSQIDLEKLREEFGKRVQRKATVLQDIRDIVEEKLAGMLDQNPLRMDYQLKYEQIVTDYNHAKDRTTIENTFRELVALANSLDEEQKRATREGLSEEELALFDILLADGIGKADREHVKRASRELLAAVRARLAELSRFWEKEQTKAEVETLILDHVYAHFPDPPFGREEKKLIAANVYAHVWQQAVSDNLGVGL
jgi:type I restriction enzyme R subunit